MPLPTGRSVAALVIVAGAALAAPAAAAPRPYTRNVAIFVYEGAELLDFSGPGEVFAAAGTFAADGTVQGTNVYTVAVSADPVTTQGFVKVVPQYTLDDCPPPDVLVLPGGKSQKVLADARFIDWLKATAPRTEVTLSVCTGAFMLAQAGLLDSLQATTWYGATAALRAAAPRATVEDGRRFIDTGRIVTTAGVSAGIDGSLHVVARLFGRRVADRTAQYMEYHWTPEAYLAQGYSYRNPLLDDAGRLREQGAMAEAEGDFAEAAKRFAGAAELRPRDGSLWYALGLARHLAGDYDGAIEANRKAEALDFQRPRVLYNLACEYARKGDADRALDLLREALAQGAASRSAVLADPDLAGLREDPRFGKLLESL